MKKFAKIYLYLQALLFSLTSTVYARRSSGGITELNNRFGKLKENVQAITGFYYAFALATVILILVFLFMKLGGLQVKPWERKETMKNIGIVLICTALLGVVGLVSSVLVGTFF